MDHNSARMVLFMLKKVWNYQKITCVNSHMMFMNSEYCMLSLTRMNLALFIRIAKVSNAKLTLVLQSLFLSNAYFSVAYANFCMLNQTKALLMQS